MTMQLDLDRRQFVIAGIGGGLAIGLGLPGSASAQSMSTRPFDATTIPGGTEINAWVVIAPDNTVLVRVAKTEMGQGAMTALPMIVCEELECDWSKVKVEYASPNRNQVENQVYRSMATNGSNGVRSSREYLQLAGASARERLKAAAAAQWNVPVAEIDAKNSEMTHRPTGRKITYGQLAARAVSVRLEREPAIKTPDQYTLMGKLDNVKRFDTPPKVNGTAIYGLDVTLPGMLTAAVKHSPVHGGKVKSFDFNAIKDRPGVKAAMAVGGVGNERAGVAVVADSFWQAKSAIDIMPLEWDDGAGASYDTDTYFKEAVAALDKPGKVAKKEGDPEAAMRGTGRKVEGTYTVPYLDHAPLEPLNATAYVTADRVEAWLGTQNAGGALTAAAAKAGIAPEKVFVNNELLGGGFGRGGGNEPLPQAITLSKALGKPVKVIWTREEVTRQGNYRPMSAVRFSATLGNDGMPVGMIGRVVSDSLAFKTNPTEFAKTEIDGTATGNYTALPYAIPNFQIEYTNMPSHLRLGFWRGPGVSQTLFQIESFIDECAIAAGKDPADYRKALLASNKDPGWMKVMNEITDKSGWGKRTFPKGTAQGIGIGDGHGTIAAVVVTVTVSQGGEVKVDEAHVAFDSGNIVNKADIIGQQEGSIAFALTAALYGEITVRKGRVVEGNFDDYQMLRIADMPDVKVHFGGLTGGSKWGGLGEPAVGPLFPAVANAVFKATGKRVRSMPLKNHDLSWS